MTIYKPMIKEIITNPTNLPDIIVKWAEFSDAGYTGNLHDGLSVTTLIAPAYQRYLRNKFIGEVTVPLTSKLWAMLGTAIHTILENINDIDKYITETRFFGQFTTSLGDMQVHGQIDCFDRFNKTLYDFKVTSKYTVAGGKSKIEWEQQMNILAHLLREHGYEVEHLSIIGIFRDHMFKDKYEQQMPKEAIQEIKIPVWSREKTVAFIFERLKAHMQHTPCTDEEKWQDVTKYAVMKKGNKRAVKLFEVQSEAQQRAYALNDLNAVGAHYIEVRLGEPTRCERYCSVNQYCDAYKAYLIAKPTVEVGEGHD